MAEPFLRRAAEWAADLRYGDVPRDVRRAALAQRASTVGAAAWTLSHPVGEAVTRTVARELPDGDGATFLGGGATSPRAASYGHAALSMAMDFDDTVLGGHTGHSAVFVPLAYAEATGAAGRDALAAHVAANEVAARLASAAAIGPFRGQQTAYVHAAGAAVARGVVEGVDAGVLADAVAVALGQPPWPLVADFLGSDAKVLSAAEPVLAGLSAVEAARQGLSGNAALVEAGGGFLDAFADHPLPEFLTGLGERWHTRAVTVKPYPGCAYVTAPVHAALALHGRLAGETGAGERDFGEPDAGGPGAREAGAGEPDAGEANTWTPTAGEPGTGEPGVGEPVTEIDPAAVESVEVFGSLFTVRVEDLAAPHVDGADSPLSALNFSVPYNVAAALRFGEHTPRQLAPERVADDRTWALADRVSVRHDPDLTLRALASEVPVGAMLRRVGWRVLPYAARSVGLVRTVRNLPALARFVRRRPLPDSLAGADKAMGARVRVTTTGGRTVEASCPHPPGFAGHPLADVESVARGKLRDGLAALAARDGGGGDAAATGAGGTDTGERADDAVDDAVESLLSPGEDPVDLSGLARLAGDRAAADGGPG